MRLLAMVLVLMGVVAGAAPGIGNRPSSHAPNIAWQRLPVAICWHRSARPAHLSRNR